MRVGSDDLHCGQGVVDHVLLFREDESLVDQVPSTSGYIEMRVVGPYRDRAQSPIVSQPSPTNASPDVAFGPLREDPVETQLPPAGSSRHSLSTLSLVHSVVVFASLAKSARTLGRGQAVSNRNNNHTPVTPRVAARRKVNDDLVFTPMTSPRRKQRRIAQGSKPSEEREPDDSDDEVGSLVMRRGAPHADRWFGGRTVPQAVRRFLHRETVRISSFPSPPATHAELLGTRNAGT
ncbi:hypothetical protein V8E53_005792 [Lactarius tabidus]